MNKSTIIRNIDILNGQILDLINQNKLDQDFIISSDLRRHIRQFKTSFKNIYYFAYGLGDTYKLHVSKTIFNINIDDLQVKAKRLFAIYSGK